MSHILRVVQLQTQSHTWPMCWYVWLKNNKSKCQCYNRVLQEGCDVHDRLWKPTVMCKNLTAWTLRYPLPFVVKDSQFPSTMGYVNIFKADSKIFFICHPPLQKNNKTTCSNFNNHKPSVHIPNNLKKIVTKSSAWIGQSAIWPTAAKNWRSGHFLWTLIYEVYFHKLKDLCSRRKYHS